MVVYRQLVLHRNASSPPPTVPVHITVTVPQPLDKVSWTQKFDQRTAWVDPRGPTTVRCESAGSAIYVHKGHSSFGISGLVTRVHPPLFCSQLDKYRTAYQASLARIQQLPRHPVWSASHRWSASSPIMTPVRAARNVDSAAEISCQATVKSAHREK